MTSVHHHQPHDKLYKSCMSDLGVAKELIQNSLSAELLKAIDFDSLKQESTEFIDNQFKFKQADLIFSVNFKNKEGKTYFYFLCEHQSKSEPLMAFTLLVLTIEIIKNHLKAYPGSSLPIVYPIVLYANQRHWKAPTDIFKLFGQAEGLARDIMFKPFTLIDVNRTADSELKSQRLAGLFQYALKYRESKDFAAFFNTLLPWLNEISELATGENLAHNVILYVVNGLESKATSLLLEKAEHYLSVKLRGDVMTIAEAFIEQGIHQGIHQGIDQVAINLLKQGIDFSTIAKATDLTLEDLAKLKNKQVTVGAVEEESIS